MGSDPQGVTSPLRGFGTAAGPGMGLGIKRRGNFKLSEPAVLSVEK